MKVEKCNVLSVDVFDVMCHKVQLERALQPSEYSKPLILLGVCPCLVNHSPVVFIHKNHKCAKRLTVFIYISVILLHGRESFTMEVDDSDQVLFPRFHLLQVILSLHGGIYL